MSCSPRLLPCQSTYWTVSRLQSRIPMRSVNFSVNQILPVESTEIPERPRLAPGNWYSTRLLDCRVYCPILLTPDSVNQAWPWVSTVIAVGRLLGITRLTSPMAVRPGVIVPIRFPVSSTNQMVPSGPV